MCDSSTLLGGATDVSDLAAESDGVALRGITEI